VECIDTTIDKLIADYNRMLTANRMFFEGGNTVPRPAPDSD